MHFAIWILKEDNKPKSKMLTIDSVISAHENHRSNDRRHKLLELYRSGNDQNKIIEMSLLLIADGSPNEIELGFYILKALASRDPVLAKYFFGLSKHKSASVRSSLAYYLGKSFSQEVRAEIYRTLLHDRAASVRKKALEQIGMRNEKWLLTEIYALRSTEGDSKVIQSIDYWIPLLENGYRVKPSSIPGRLEITVLVSSGISSGTLEATDITDPRIQTFVADLRARVDELHNT